MTNVKKLIQMSRNESWVVSAIVISDNSYLIISDRDYLWPAIQLRLGGQSTAKNLFSNKA